MLTWDVPEGYWKIYVIYLTRDAKGRNDYINFLDKASCRLLIDAVYEPHFARYEKYFGNVIAGFFSETPSRPSETRRVIREATSSESRICLFLGQRRWRRPWIRLTGTADWRGKLNLLWSEAEDDHEKAWMRTAYMNAVSRKVEECFSRQLGDSGARLMEWSISVTCWRTAIPMRIWGRAWAISSGDWPVSTWRASTTSEARYGRELRICPGDCLPCVRMTRAFTITCWEEWGLPWEPLIPGKKAVVCVRILALMAGEWV